MGRGPDTTPFVGRDDDLAVLHDEWAAVVAGATRICWVVGDAGIGKTALVRRFCDGLAAPQRRWVSAEEGEQRLRFGVAEQLLRAPAAAATELDVGADLLLALGGNDEPVAVVVDDLQWADPPSLGALRFALRRTEADAVLVVLITRPDPWATLGDQWRRFLEDGHRVRRIDVAALTAGDVARLADGRLDAGAAGRLRDHTGGHTLHTAVLLDELGVDRIAAAGAVLPAPRSFADLLLSRVAALPSATQSLLSAGAVLGSPFPIADAAALAGAGVSVDALGAAADAGIVTDAGDGSASFSHLLVRGAVYADLSAEARRDLHRAAAGVTSGLAALLHRVEAAVGPDDALAADLDAAASVERGAGNATVASDLRLAAARVSVSPAGRDRRTIAAVEVLLEAGNQPRAVTLRPLLEGCPPTVYREHVLALLDLRTGQFPATLSRSEASLAAPPDAWADLDGVGDVRSRTLAVLGFVRWAAGDVTGALAAVDEALQGDTGWGSALTSYVRAMSMMQLGRTAELQGNEVLDRVVMADVDRLTVEGTVRFYGDDFVGATSTLREVVHRSRRGEAAQLSLVAMGMLAEAEFRGGRWDDASIHAELAVSLATDAEQAMALVQAQTVAVEVQAARGRFTEADRHLEVATAWVELMPAWAIRTRAAMARAELAIARDDAAALAAAAAPLTTEPLASQLEQLPSWRWRALVAEALLVGGSVDAAAVAVEGLAAVVASRGHTSARPDLARLQGQLAEARGDDAGALAAYSSLAGDAAAGSQSPLADARLAMARGLLQQRLGDRVGATASLRAAQDGFGRLGALPFLERCSAALGAGSSGGPARPALELSPRQEAVALLVADGRTNKEIAAELYVSVKAVEYHLGQIYARTGVQTRRELAARMRS